MIKSEAHGERRDETAEIVAVNLRDTMKLKRWTGRSLALSLGLKPIYVQRRMSGEVEMSATDLRVFADQLEITVQDFFKETPQITNRSLATVHYLRPDTQETPERDTLAPVTKIGA